MGFICTDPESFFGRKCGSHRILFTNRDGLRIWRCGNCEADDILAYLQEQCGQEQCGPARQRSRGTALTPEAGGGIGCRCRSPATGRCLGSCRCPGHMPGATGLEALWQTWSRRRRSHELRFGG